LRAGQFVGLMFSRERNVVWKKCYMKCSGWNQMKIWSLHLLDNFKQLEQLEFLSNWSRRRRKKFNRFWNLEPGHTESQKIEPYNSCDNILFKEVVISDRNQQTK